MPAIKCAVCGHRILPSAALKACTNCGSPLSTAKASSTDTTEAIIPEREQAREMPPSVPPAIRLPQAAARPASRLPARREVSLQTRQNMAPSRPDRKRITTEQADEEEEEYVHIPFTTVTEEREKPSQQQKQQPVDPPLWLNDKLPFGFPRRPPDIFGTIITVQAQQEMMTTTGFFSQMRDAFWPVQGEVSGKEKENVNITMLRVRTNDGKQKDARMQGYLRGANISLGDTVSLWGRKRQGMITVYKAFNHTSKAIITTSSMKSSLGFIFLLILLVVAAFFMLVYQYHIHLPFPGL